jgi:hypothetical protein
LLTKITEELPYQYKVTPSQPVIRNNGSGSDTHVSGQEFFCHIGNLLDDPMFYDADDFHASTYFVNPGLSSFAWLSNQAHNFEKYKFTKLKFTFVPRYTSSGLNGSVGLCIDYDADDSPVADYKSYVSNAGAVLGPVTKTFTVNANMKWLNDTNQWRYVRNTPVVDRTVHDPCSLLVVCHDLSSNIEQKSVGEIWVSYDVVFRTPQTQFRELSITGYNKYTSTTVTSVTSNVPYAAEFPTKEAGDMEVDMDYNGDHFVLPKGALELDALIDMSAGTGVGAMESTISLLKDGVVVVGSGVTHMWENLTPGVRESIKYTANVLADGIAKYTVRTILKSANGNLFVTPRSLTMRALN